MASGLPVESRAQAAGRQRARVDAGEEELVPSEEKKGGERAQGAVGTKERAGRHNWRAGPPLSS